MRTLVTPLRLRARSGFSLAELLVVMVVFSIIGLIIVRVLSTGQRAFDAQVQHVDLQQNTRVSAAILPNELRELDASDGDIVAMDSISITVRSMRQLGVICTLPALGGSLAAVTFVVRDTLMAARYFTAGDSLLVYYEGATASRTDDGWMTGALTSVGATTACTDGSGRSGKLFTASLKTDSISAPVQKNTAGYVPLGAPIHAFRDVTYKRYLWTDNKYYVAIDSSGTSYPIIGPLSDALGFKMTYYDSLTPATRLANAARLSVSRINIALSMMTNAPLRKISGSPSPDTSRITLDVTLRNNRRY